MNPQPPPPQCPAPQLLALSTRAHLRNLNSSILEYYQTDVETESSGENFQNIYHLFICFLFSMKLP